MIYLVSNQKSFLNDFKYISLEESIEMLISLEEIGLDTETTGLSCHTKQLLSIQLGNQDFQIVYDIASYFGKIPKLLKEFMQTYKGLWIIQNAKFDLQFLYKQDIILKNIFDTMLAEIIITIGIQDDGRDLKTLAWKYCGAELDKSVRGKIIQVGLTKEVIIYAANDITYLPKIKRAQYKQLETMDLLNAIKIDNNFVKVLAYIEFCGIKLDWSKWIKRSNQFSEESSKAQEELEDYLYSITENRFKGTLNMFTGRPECLINWDSPKQVIPLFESLGINCTIKQKGKEKKVCDKKSLQFQIKDFKILQLYFKYKQLAKITDTYGESWKSLINENTKRIHCSYTQLLKTGRMGSSNPNMQNLPHDAETRACFIAEPGNVMVCADYSAQESIILANFAKDEALIAFYKKGLKDMHSFVAYLLFPELQRVPIDELTNDELKWIKDYHKKERDIAKTAEFAIGYGGNGSTIAKNTGVSNEQGTIVYNTYFERFSGLKSYFDRGFNKAAKKHYIQFNNVTKRKYFISESDPFIKYADIAEWNPKSKEAFEYRKASAEIQRLSQNYPIQGSAADCTKIALILIFKEILKNNWFNKVKIVNVVHDEIELEGPIELKDTLTALVKNSMEKAGTYFCKYPTLSADVEVGDHWIH